MWWVKKTVTNTHTHAHNSAFAFERKKTHRTENKSMGGSLPLTKKSVEIFRTTTITTAEIRFYTFNTIFTENKHENFSIERKFVIFLVSLPMSIFCRFPAPPFKQHLSYFFSIFVSHPSSFFATFFFLYSVLLYLFCAFFLLLIPIICFPPWHFHCANICEWVAMPSNANRREKKWMTKKKSTLNTVKIVTRITMSFYFISFGMYSSALMLISINNLIVSTCVD